MNESKYPAGWDAARTQRLIDRAESITEEEQVAEDEAAFAERPGHAVISVPDDMLPAIRQLLASRASA